MRQKSSRARLPFMRVFASSRRCESRSSHAPQLAPRRAASRFFSVRASAGDAPPVDIVTRRSPSRKAAGRKKSQSSGAVASLTRAPASFAALPKAAFTIGSSVAQKTSRGAVCDANISADARRFSQAMRPAAASAANDGASSGATTVTAAPAARSPSVFRCATAPPPATSAACPSMRR